MAPGFLRRCVAPGCSALVRSGRCAEHARAAWQRRGKVSQRGYGYTWQLFRERFKALLIRAGIAPACGASLPNGPSMRESRCKANGLTNGEDLQLHHDPPLTDGERSVRALVEDVTRVGFLCRSCHSATTARSMAS